MLIHHPFFPQDIFSTLGVILDEDIFPITILHLLGFSLKTLDPTIFQAGCLILMIA